MGRWFRAIIILLIIIIVGLLLLVFCHGGVGRKCGKGSTRPDCRIQISLGFLQYSSWPDGSLALAAPLINDGSQTARTVKVTSLTVSGGSLVTPVSFPVALGDLQGGAQAVVQARLNGLTVPGSYTVTLKGTYLDGSTTKTFNLSSPLATSKIGGGPIPTKGSTVVTHHTTGLLPPGPIHNENTNRDQHPLAVPIGPTQKPFAVSPQGTGPAKAGPGSSVTIITDTPGNRGSGGLPPDPSTAEANGGGVVLSTGNTYLLYSVDDGKTFTQVNPTTILPNADGGLCCDQVVVYDKGTDLFFWLLQYNADGSGNNRLRVAYAHPADLKANIDNWTWFDLTNGTFNSKNSLDYPDLALTGTYLYASVDGTDSKGNNGGFIVARMPLSQMLSGSGHSISIGYISPNETTDATRAFASRLTQDSPSAMYWAGQVDTSHLEVFHWDDASNQVASNSAGVNSWCNTDYTSAAPDGGQWIDNTRPAGTGGVIAAAYKAGTGGAHGQIWFGWGSGRDASGCTQCRPQPYVKIVQIDDTSLNSVGEYHIWNTPYAFAYPSLASAPGGDIGVAVSFGGPSNYAASTVGYLGDYVVYYVDESGLTTVFYNDSSGNFSWTAQPGGSGPFTRYGDMFAVRRSGSGDLDFSTEGYSFQLVDPTKSTNCGTPPGCTYNMHYEQFGRAPPGPVR